MDSDYAVYEQWFYKNLSGEASMASSKAASPFGKPKAAAQDGTFSFKLPDTLGSGRGRIPKGKYVGRCVSIMQDTSKAGNPMWVWVFVITAGPQAGRDFKLWTVLTDDAAWKIAETLKALGQEAEEGQEIRIKKADVIGVGCTLHIKDDVGQDGDGEFSKLDKISAHPKGAGYKAGKLAAVAAEEEEDEDEPVDEEEESDEDTGDLDADLDDYGTGDEEEEVIDEEEEEEPAPRKPAKKTAPAPAKKGGKAPASLKKRK